MPPLHHSYSQSTVKVQFLRLNCELTPKKGRTVCFTKRLIHSSFQLKCKVKHRSVTISNSLEEPNEFETSSKENNDKIQRNKFFDFGTSEYQKASNCDFQKNSDIENWDPSIPDPGFYMSPEEGDVEFDEPQNAEVGQKAELKDIPFFGVRGDPEPNDKAYESVPFPNLQPDDEDMLEKSFKVLYALPKFFALPLAKVGSPGLDNIFSENLVSPNVIVECPMGALTGSSHFQAWLQYLGDCDVDWHLDYIYLESRPEPENRFLRFIHCSWQMRLSENLIDSLKSWGAMEWWEDNFPEALNNIKTMVEQTGPPSQSDGEKQVKTLVQLEEQKKVEAFFQGPGLTFWAHTRFLVQKEGMITKAETDWLMFDPKFGIGNFAKCHLFLSLLKKKAPNSIRWTSHSQFKYD